VVTKRSGFLARPDLRPVDGFIAARPAVLGAHDKLLVPDATHLSTAIRMDAHRFIAGTSEDFDK